MTEQEKKNIQILVWDLQKRFGSFIDDTMKNKMLKYYASDGDNYQKNSMDLRLVLATGKIEEYLSSKNFFDENDLEKPKRLILK